MAEQAAARVYHAATPTFTERYTSNTRSTTKARTEARMTVTVTAFMTRKPGDPGLNPRLVNTIPAISTNTDASRKKLSWGKRREGWRGWESG